MNRVKDNLFHRVKFVVEQASAFGVNVNPTSRIGLIQRLVTELDGGPAGIIRVDHPQFQEALEGVRDVQIIAFILRQLPQAKLPADFRERVKTMLGDASLPQNSSDSTKGRDMQAELYVAAVCVNAGIEPEFHEPDLMVKVSGKTFGVAVKRVKSLDRLEERIKSAAGQVQRAGVPGFIVADLTTAMNPENKRVTATLSDQEFGGIISDRLRDVTVRREQELVEWVRGSGVQGLFVTDHHVRLRQQDGKYGLDSMTHGLSLSPYNQRRHREFEAFAKQFVRGLATPPILVQPPG